MNEPRLIDANEVREFPRRETSGTNEMMCDWIYETLPEDISYQYADELATLCWKIIDGMVNVIDTSETIDLETLPIVQELREKLNRAEELIAYISDEFGRNHVHHDGIEEAITEYEEEP